MKKLFTLLSVFFVTATLWGQSPEKISYQAVIRNSTNDLVTNQTVGIRISILQGSATGTAVYVETQSPGTNANGLINIEIGNGVIQSGSFANIDWGNGPYYIKTQTDPNGGTNYTILGTSQLISVPYALYAETAEKSFTTYSVGDFTHGGIVFWLDETKGHGLVCAKTDQTSGVRWYSGTNSRSMALGDGPLAGNMNTAIIIANEGYGDGQSYAARFCNELKITEEGITYADWYLPSIGELNLMYQNKATIDATATAHGGIAFGSSWYWSSTENGIDSAWSLYFPSGAILHNLKSATLRVRAVRSF